MKHLFFSIMIFLCMSHANAEPFEGWTTQEKILFATSEIALLADYKSTASVLYPSRGYYETNIFIGPQPSRQTLNLWFAGWMIGNYFIADYLSHENRSKWLLTVTITESIASAHNVRIGASIRF